MKKLFYFSVIVLALSACSSRKKTVGGVMTNTPRAKETPTIPKEVAKTNNERVQRENKVTPGTLTYPAYTVASYVDRFKAIAIKEMNLYGIPASITLAQGLFESGFGNGELARVANNHFGIKCTSDWTGRSYYKDDDRPNDCFRVYNNPEESYRDHSEFLKRKRYAKLFELDKNDYEGWAFGLKECGYATNPQYPQLLINAIVKYNLAQYDRPEGEIQKIKREDRVLAQINKNAGKAAKDSIVSIAPGSLYPGSRNNTPTTISSSTQGRYYTVTTGDTLYNISKRFNLTVDQLKALNNMTDNSIKIGQQLIIAQ
ncbi:glucosaminidase domain-containing protein [Mucilaginibacter daejeonensis]|uniref:glucosaminidase domain-containing protein n=1 Tax=Mucilaginibacter daejeonensis TaxID=398049 RepID=UPI00374CF0D6